MRTRIISLINTIRRMRIRELRKKAVRTRIISPINIIRRMRKQGLRKKAVRTRIISPINTIRRMRKQGLRKKAVQVIQSLPFTMYQFNPPVMPTELRVRIGAILKERIGTMTGLRAMVRLPSAAARRRMPIRLLLAWMRKRREIMPLQRAIMPIR